MSVFILLDLFKVGFHIYFFNIPYLISLQRRYQKQKF